MNLFICLLNKREESSTTVGCISACGLGIVVRKPDLQGLDRAVEFLNSIETLADVFAMVSCQARRAVRTAFLTVGDPCRQ